MNTRIPSINRSPEQKNRYNETMTGPTYQKKHNKNMSILLFVALSAGFFLTFPSFVSAQTEQTNQSVCNTQKDVCIDLSIRLQGILKKPPTELRTIPVAVTLQGGELLQEPVSKTITMTAGQNGIWTGKVQYTDVFITGTSASNFRITLKPPQHLKRIICDTRPVEYNAGAYTCSDEDSALELKLGKNTLDFTQMYFFSGDLPIDDKQNGVINSEDIVFLRTNLGTPNKSLQVIGDLNRDGIVDSQDLSLAVFTLSVTNVDEDLVLF
jgi:hypothetical protein